MKRFQHHIYYTYIGPTLLFINPYFYNNYAPSSQPHVHDLTSQALLKVKARLQGDVSIIISGESGAGKSENTKQCVLRLSDNCDFNEQLSALPSILD